MVVGVLRLELHLYSPGNLKEKRGIVRSLLGRCRANFPVSCAETGLYDVWQRTELGFAVVERDVATIQTLFERIEEEIARSGFAEAGERFTEFLHY